MAKKKKIKLKKKEIINIFYNENEVCYFFYFDDNTYAVIEASDFLSPQDVINIWKSQNID
jgi:hypothetical protein